jgi:16S rRNA G966 N2-methylase RsmD
LSAVLLPGPSLEERAAWVVEDGDDPQSVEIPHSVKTNYLTHGLFRYVGKLPPPLVAYMLARYTSRGDVILDPMCGGGTTAIEAVSSGRTSVNFDINPVSRLVTQGVATPEDASSLRAFVESVIESAPASRPPAPLAEYFSPETYGLIAEGLRAAATPMEKVLFLSIARKASQANTKKINTVVDKTKTPVDAQLLLRQAAKRFGSAFDELAAYEPAHCSVGEAGAGAVPLDSESVDFVLLHPPYLSNTAFSEVTHLQLLLLGVDPKTLRKMELAMRGSYFHVTDGLRKYLVGWYRILEEAARVVRPGGHIGIVNGDGRTESVRIPVGTITEEYGVDLGLKLRQRAVHRLNNQTGMTLSHRMTEQHLLVFEK